MYVIIIIQKTAAVPKSSDNPSSVAHESKIIWQSQIRLKMPSRQHVDENARALRRISEMIRVCFEVNTKYHYSICQLRVITEGVRKIGAATETDLDPISVLNLGIKRQL